MKGLILAGGSGTRLRPLTTVVVKQLLPVYDKPMIYYPLSTLMAAQIREIAIICNPGDLDQFQELLGTGEEIGISLTYIVQNLPRGIADAFLVSEEFIGGDGCALILGDNIFHGSGLGRQLSRFNVVDGAQVFAYHVNNPEQYGVIELDEFGQPVKLIEKPSVPTSNLAVPGLYFFDNSVVAHAASIKPSLRGELEIVDVLQIYLEAKKLHVELMSRGSAWLDTGTFESLMSAGNYVQVIEARQGFKIGCIEEVAYLNQWINQSQLNKIVNSIGNTPYSNYLKNLIETK